MIADSALRVQEQAAALAWHVAAFRGEQLAFQKLKRVGVRLALVKGGIWTTNYR